MWIKIKDCLHFATRVNCAEKSGKHQIWIETSKSSYMIIESEDKTKIDAYFDMIFLAIQRGDTHVEIY